MSKVHRHLSDLHRAISSNIFTYCDVLRFTPTMQQRQGLEIVQWETLAPRHLQKRRLSISSGQGTGKTTISWIIGSWRSLHHTDALTIVTAPTQRQCSDVWLAEGRRLVEAGDPVLSRLFTFTGRKMLIAGRPTWGCWTATSNKPENLQGYHEPGMTFIAEEASGIKRDIDEQIKGTLSNDDSLYVQIGNPNYRDCAFYDSFHSQRDQWHKLVFDARDSPLVSKQNIQRIIDEYGIDSDVFRVRVQGKFPLMDPNNLVSVEDAEACTKLDMYELARDLSPIHPDAFGGCPNQFGLDLARFGEDESTISQRRGCAIIGLEAFAKREPEQVLWRAFKMQDDIGWSNQNCFYSIDAGGMGQGLMGQAYRAGKRLLEFHTQSVPIRHDYGNLMAEAWFSLARQVKARKIYLPPDNRMIQQLTTRQYYLNRKGKLVLEEKDQYKKRGFDSPDRAEAVCMSTHDGFSAPLRISARK